MPEFEVTFTRKQKGTSKTGTTKVQAVGETHARSVAMNLLKSLFKCFIKIIFVKQV